MKKSEKKGVWKRITSMFTVNIPVEEDQYIESQFPQRATSDIYSYLEVPGIEVNPPKDSQEFPEIHKKIIEFIATQLNID